MGACLYTLVYGRIPFTAPNLYQLFQVVQNENVAFPENVPISEPLKDLLQRLLTKVWYIVLLEQSSVFYASFLFCLVLTEKKTPEPAPVQQAHMWLSRIPSVMHDCEVLWLGY